VNSYYPDASSLPGGAPGNIHSCHRHLRRKPLPLTRFRCTTTTTFRENAARFPLIFRFLQRRGPGRYSRVWMAFPRQARPTIPEMKRRPALGSGRRGVPPSPIIFQTRLPHLSLIKAGGGVHPPGLLGKSPNQLISDKPGPHATAGDNSSQGTGHWREKTDTLLNLAEGGYQRRSRSVHAIDRGAGVGVGDGRNRREC